MELTNARLSLRLDEATGSIARLADASNGRVYLDAREGGRSDARLFRLMVPAAAWSSRYADSHAAPSPVVRRTATGATITWSRLKLADGAEAAIEAQVEVAAAETPDEFRFRLRVTNNTPDNIIEPLFPWLGGWTGWGGKGKDMMSIGGNWSQQDPHAFPLNKGTTYARVHQRAQFSYPVGLYAPWTDISGPFGGIGHIVYMETPQNGLVSIENLAGYGPGLRLAWGWVFSTVIRPGETWSSPPVGISIHTGDWHDTSDRFQTWMDDRFVPPPTPPALRRMIGFQNAFLRGFDGRPFAPLERIPAIAAEGRRYGVDHLCLWDFVTMGNYAKHGDLDVLDFTADEKALLRLGLRQARAEGTNVSALINWRLLNPGQRSFAAREAAGELARCYNGSPRMESYPSNHDGTAILPAHLGPSCFIASPFSSSWRERVLRQISEYMDLGFVSLFFDQPFETLADYSHLDKGCRPEDTHAAVATLIAEVRRRLHENDPAAYLIGEFCDAYMCQHIDLWMSWYTEAEHLIRARYSVPRTMQSWVVDSNPGQASHAFALGAYLCLCTHGNEATLAAEPAFGEHVAALARLRELTAERTVLGRFRQTKGLEVDGDGLVAYRFESTAGTAVIAAAPGKPASGELRLTDDSVPTGDGTLYPLHGQPIACRGKKQSLHLGANEVLVWYV